MAYTLTLTDLALASAGVWLVYRFLKKPALPYPPGPPGLPVIGNALDIPKTAMQQYKQFTEWDGKYGSIIHLSALGLHIVVLNDQQVARDLLDKRSAIYSDRPTMAMAGELCGWDRPLVMHHYDDTFKEFRRYFFKLFGTRQSLEAFYPLFESEGHVLMRRILAAPGDFPTHLRKCAGSIILKVTYGYDVNASGSDPVVDVVNEGMRQMDDLLSSGWLVDLMPWMKSIPASFPGATFQKIAQHYRKTLDTMADLPYGIIKKKIAGGNAESCFVTQQLGEGDITPAKEDIIKWAATSIYGGGADTTVSALHSFFLAMTLYPEVQAKAQAEIDAVVGRDRLPTLADRPQLPYITALMNEVLRWSPVAPLAIPHATMQDDVYQGYLIPKGSLVIPNIWFMANNPEIYKSPRVFNPDRFIATPEHPAEPDPHNVVFGFGRRICPGINLADATAWLEIALSLAVLTVSKAVDENGNAITPEYKYTEENVTHPVSFPCSIKARDARAEALIAVTE
ncbi:unnamed protein product [Peniophora sp. CBMAI 1063]|nr:unnamed protein product [Peniophora sp. CBMAI 1063]